MFQWVYEALKAQHGSKHLGDLNLFSVTKKVIHWIITAWIEEFGAPTLKILGLKHRRAYETRHTAATLWLAAGEDPTWIARQLGHANTMMLFKVYSRYVPNNARRDGAVSVPLVATSKPMQSTNQTNNWGHNDEFIDSQNLVHQANEKLVSILSLLKRMI